MSPRRWARRPGSPAREHLLAWQAASVLLAYPDEPALARMALVPPAVAGLPARTRGPLVGLAEHVTGRPPLEAQQDYVQTFDWKRRRALFLTYWTAGDTRNRGRAILRFAEAYRSAGVAPPPDELADHLAVVLEFAATVDPDAGHRLLAEHRTPLAMLADALTEAHSPYAAAVDAVAATLPPPGPDDLAAARRLAAAGPPAEAVGLDAYPAPTPSTALPFPTVGVPG